MALLEELKPGVLVKGLLPGNLVTVIDVKQQGSSCVELIYKDASGHFESVLLYRESETGIEIASEGLPWSFDADGATFRLTSEAYRIHLAYLFDPLIAVHTSLIEPLPHQITAVYETMLGKQPLRYLLADDPGAGKTIMTGLLIKELMIWGDLRRCLIVSPGNLVEQWQDELSRKFQMTFDILTNDRLEASASGNAFSDMPLCIARLDKLSRDEHVQAKLEQTDWDLVVIDEAHKMSATFFSGEVKFTKRYQLGQLLGKVTRHLLLLTATPHNGKEEDFQLFMALLDQDRFEGRFRGGVQKVDTSDLMRHLVKEQLYKFDGTPLFPERKAYTVNYKLSGLEETLYQEVSDYVCQEFNRADALEINGRKGTIGFALTTLQRRLASSPEAIYQSLKRRKARLEHRLQEEQDNRLGAPGGEQTGLGQAQPLHYGSEGDAPIELLQGLPILSEDDLDDLDDAPDAELEETEERVVDLASAARTIAELEVEIAMLARLEELALQVRRSGTDRKWEGLASLLQNNAEMFDACGHRRKLVIFTEHRDTLHYLTERIRIMLGYEEAVVNIHGGMGREERRKAQEAFTQDKRVQVLVATDAAGEGINLQRAHLMVNYDLPWNPNRLEQRFGRIHRIGQTEVCHLWNLVAAQTREGEVFHTLLKKLEEEREALGGRVFDVLGDVLYDNRPLRDLIIEAIRYGDRPDVRDRLFRVVDKALDHEHLQALLDQRALAREVMDVVRVRQVREDMERATARRLQPHFIAAFFLEALKRLGGDCFQREPRRYEIKHVPPEIRKRIPRSDVGRTGASPVPTIHEQVTRTPILKRYERVVFEKELINVPGMPPATLICPGHPLLDVTIDLILEQHRDLLKQGTMLVDPNDSSEDVRVLFYLEHSIQDASIDNSTGKRRVISRQMQFVELDGQETMHAAGYAPFLDYRPLTEEDQTLIPQLDDIPWLKSGLEEQARTYAITELVPRHFEEVKQRREEQITKTLGAVTARLTSEISYWDNRAAIFQAQEGMGKSNARQNWQKARERADELYARLERRTRELEQERQLSPLPPIVVGGVLVIPAGLITKLCGQPQNEDEAAEQFAHETVRVERLAMEAVMQAERQLGYIPRDVSAEKCGYDIESKMPGTGKLRFIEVKGRVKDSTTVIVTKNEVLTALNKPDDFFLAIVLVDGETTTPYYVTRPFQREPDFDATSVIYKLDKLLNKGVIPV